jgi:hypothetical protein
LRFGVLFFAAKSQIREVFLVFFEIWCCIFSRRKDTKAQSFFGVLGDLVLYFFSPQRHKGTKFFWCSLRFSAVFFAAKAQRHKVFLVFLRFGVLFFAAKAQSREVFTNQYAGRTDHENLEPETSNPKP